MFSVFQSVFVCSLGIDWALTNCAIITVQVCYTVKHLFASYGSITYNIIVCIDQKFTDEVLSITISI